MFPFLAVVSSGGLWPGIRDESSRTAQALPVSEVLCFVEQRQDLVQLGDAGRRTL